MNQNPKNYQASRGWELDAMHQIMSCMALTSHLMEKLSQLEEEHASTPEKDQVIQLLTLTSEVRRNVTALLAPDTTYSCALKHALEVYQYSTECFLASDTYPFALVNKSYRLLTGIVSKALGYDLEFCGRCFWDERLATLKVKKEQADAIKADALPSSDALPNALPTAPAQPETQPTNTETFHTI